MSRVAGREGPSFISPAEQRRKIESTDHNIVDWAEDLDQPGSRVERPGLIRAMELVETGQADGIIVAKLDRFGRSVVQQGELIERLRAADGALLTVAEGIDTRTDAGKLIATIICAIAEWELDRIREGWASSRAAATERGVWIAEAPVGYQKAPDGGLVVKPDTGPAVTEAFKRRASGDSWAKIARWLNDGGIPSKRGGAWTVASIRNMIRNRAYLGGPHQPLTTPAIQEAANAARGVVPGRSGRASGMLSGILRCAGCRYAMKLSMGRTRHGKPYTEYRCKSARGESAGGPCPSPAAVKATVIDPFVLDAFWGYVGEWQASGIEPDDLIEDAEAEALRAQAELDAVLDRRLVEALGGDDSAAYLEAVRRRREALDAARLELAGATRRAQAASLGTVNLRELWPDLSLYEHRKLLASALDCVFVRRTPSGGGAADIAARAFVCFHGDAPDLPRRGVRWTPKPFDFPPATEALGENSGEGSLE